MQSAFHTVAQHAEESEMLHKHAAALCTKSGHMIKLGVNNPRTRKLIAGKQPIPCCHAEMQVLTDAPYCEKQDYHSSSDCWRCSHQLQAV